VSWNGDTFISFCNHLPFSDAINVTATPFLSLIHKEYLAEKCAFDHYHQQLPAHKKARRGTAGDEIIPLRL